MEAVEKSQETGFSRDKRAIPDVSSQCLRQHAQDCAITSQTKIPAWRGREGEKPTPIYGATGKSQLPWEGDSVSFKGIALVGWKHSSYTPTLKNIWTTQVEPTGFLVNCCLRAQSWLDRKGGLGLWEVEAGANIIKVYCMTFSKNYFF